MSGNDLVFFLVNSLSYTIYIIYIYFKLIKTSVIHILNLNYGIKLILIIFVLYDGYIR